MELYQKVRQELIAEIDCMLGQSEKPNPGFFADGLKYIINRHTRRYQMTAQNSEARDRIGVEPGYPCRDEQSSNVMWNLIHELESRFAEYQDSGLLTKEELEYAKGCFEHCN